MIPEGVWCHCGCRYRGDWIASMLAHVASAYLLVPSSERSSGRSSRRDTLKCNGGVRSVGGTTGLVDPPRRRACREWEVPGLCPFGPGPPPCEYRDVRQRADGLMPSPSTSPPQPCSVEVRGGRRSSSPAPSGAVPSAVTFTIPSVPRS